MKIAIAILNWNGYDLLKTFLPSVVKYSEGATIYVIDNKSTDDSCAFIRREFPKVRLVKNNENYGFSGGYNKGLKNLNEDIFILLNNDVEVTEGWLTPIWHLFETQEDVAVVQPKILDYKRKTHFEYAGAAGGFIDKYGYPYCRGRIFDTLEEDKGQYDQNIPIFWASGACLAIRRQVFYEAGALDENYFAHQEEIDLCWRVQNLGYKVMFAFASQIYHKGGSTLSAYNTQKTFLNFRNSLFNLIKNTASPMRYYLIFMRLILDAFAGLKFLASGEVKHFFAILKAHISFYKHFSSVFKQRSVQFKLKKYATIHSIVWSYFIQKKNKYTNLQ